MSDVQRRITGFWSAIASDYEAHPGNVPEFGSDEHARWVTAVRDALPGQSSDVLDVATGTGFVALIAAELAHRVTGVDLSTEMLAEARITAVRRGLDVRLEEGDAVAPPFAPATFDVVTSRHLLWTLRHPGAAMRSWLRLLRPDGYVVAFDGFWFAPPDDSPDAPPDAGADAEPNVFERHYTAETRAAIPFMGIDALDPVVAAFDEAGFTDVQVSELPELVNTAAGDAVPYQLIARR